MSMTGEHDTTADVEPVAEAADGSVSDETTAPESVGPESAADPGLQTSALETATLETATLDDEHITRTLDRLSLTQALVDFELANARVLDLTARLVEANERVVRQQADADALRGEIDALRGAAESATARLREVQASRTYRIARRLAAITGAHRKG